MPTLQIVFGGNVFKNPARYTKLKYPFLRYMYNNGGVKQTPDPLTLFFWSVCVGWGGGGDFVACVTGRITIVAGKYFCILGAERRLAATHHSGKIAHGSAAKKVSCT